MTNLHLAAGIATLLPLFGSMLWFWIGKRFGEKPVSFGAVGFLFISFFATVYLFFNVTTPVQIDFYEWFKINETASVSFSFLLDPLSLSLGLIVTGVGSLIHLYATGYMKNDPGYGRFFSYLNLFIFSMLMLIFNDSLVGMFLGWEGVGLCSYLLISFWFSDKANAQAGKKAFVVNRIGDLGFLIAIFSLFKVFGTLSISEFLTVLQEASLTGDQIFWTQVACAGLVLGATGKSAQIPLYVWLPDAMAGPTPVSALIHAATMVTAGVYMACRLQSLFLIHPMILEALGFIGGLTAFFAATIAIFQYDIKKVLAYSTISQLGYMFLAVGLVSPTAAYFHLITHAFFKALLFLGAGSVIIGLHHQNDMRKMGGLRKFMPVTFWTMTIGVLAISGIPPLSGFVSKDEILHAVGHSHNGWLIFFAFGTAFMTAFYMGRLWLMTFFGTFRGDHEPHESPLSMTSVLIVLAVLSVFGGFLNWPHLWGGGDLLGHYLGAVVQQAPIEATPEAVSSSIKLAVASSLIGLLGLGLAWRKYKTYDEKEFESRFFNLFKNKYYGDEIYDFVFVRNAWRLGKVLWKQGDEFLIDGFLNGVASVANKLAKRLRGLQTGLAQQYVLWLWLGILLLVFGAWVDK